jgi:hypothetical protein
MNSRKRAYGHFEAQSGEIEQQVSRNTKTHNENVEDEDKKSIIESFMTCDSPSKPQNNNLLDEALDDLDI